MARNQILNAAKASKKDEFYTSLEDIERELRHYTPHFQGKTVLCNCDDPRVSNFFAYFAYNFELKGSRGSVFMRVLQRSCYVRRMI